MEIAEPTRIKELRERIEKVEASLDERRTPYLKGRLRMAAHMLDDAEAGLRHAEKANSKFRKIWIDFAEVQISSAAHWYLKITQIIAAYGGADNIEESDRTVQ